MKKKMYNDEELLRDKMLRHEFPADPQAWEQMEGMLNGTTPPPDVVPVPLPAASAPAATVFQSAMAWLAGLGLFGLLSVLAVSRTAQPTSGTAPTAPLREHRETTAQPRSTGQSAAANNTPDTRAAQPAQQPTGAAPTGGVFLEKNAETHSFFQGSGTPANKAASARSISAEQKQMPKPIAYSTASGTDASAHDAPSSPVRLPDDPIATDLNTTTADSDSSTASPASEPSTAPSTETATAPLRSPVDVAALPKADLLTLHVVRRLRMPKVAVPAPPTFQERRFQVGAALGGQWAIVNRSINQIALLPTFGLSLTGKVAPRWWAETGLMWRKVKGYDLTATWDATGIGANGLSGKWGVGVQVTELDFLEVPLLAKYALRNSDQRLMAGVRYARVFPRMGGEHNYSYSVNSYSPSGDFQPKVGDGIRRHDLALTVGAEARVHRNLWVDIRHSQGLYDLTYDAFFGNTNIDRTAETQLTLRYYFWSF